MRVSRNAARTSRPITFVAVDGPSAVMILAANFVDSFWNGQGSGGGGSAPVAAAARSAANPADGSGARAAPQVGQNRFESGTCLSPQLRHALICGVRIILAQTHINCGLHTKVGLIVGAAKFAA